MILIGQIDRVAGASWSYSHHIRENHLKTLNSLYPNAGYPKYNAK